MSEMLGRDLQLVDIARRGTIWVSAIVVIIFHAISWADDKSEPRDNRNLRGEFTIGTGGRLILFPVAVNGQTSLFMLDTGACRSCFDISLRDSLGEVRGSQVLQTPAGHKRVKIYDWPNATLNGQSLKTDLHVACIDLTEFRQGVNEKIFGVIGMDVLRKCRLNIDFDRGIARFLDSLPVRRDELGVRIPIEFSETGAPFLVGMLTEETSERFLIDTGAQGNSLRSEVFDQLLDQKLIRLGSSYRSVTVGGEAQGRRGQLKRLSIGSISHEGLRMSRVNISAIGLRYFSRFQVTFDFPERAIFLKEGENYAKAEPHATSGMALNWIDNNVIVISVKSGGPAEAAGVRPNDILVRINGKAASEYDHFSLRCLLTSEGGIKVPMRVRRDRIEFNVELTLEED